MKCSLHPDMHVSREDCWELPQCLHSPSRDRTGQGSLLSLSSHLHQIWANLFQAQFFQLSGKYFCCCFFFFSDQPIHPHRLGHLHSACFLPEGGVFLVYTLGVKRLFSWFGLWMKWRGARHRILEDNLATPPKDTHTHSQPLLLILCGSRHHMLRLPSWLLVTSLFMDAFPDGLGEKIWVPTREQRVQGFATPLLSAGLQLQNRTELSSAGKSASQKIQGSVQ